MRNHQHPWNLRRIFGRQFVGYVGRPACHEAGIAARVIPAQSSRWTSREPEDADLPTCRLADLPTCRLGRGWPTGFRPAHSPPVTVQALPQPSGELSRTPPQTAPPPPSDSSQAPATVQRSVSVSSLAIILHPSSPPFPLEIARNP